jgi:hypothetical protein
MEKLTASISTLYAVCFIFTQSETWKIEEHKQKKSHRLGRDFFIIDLKYYLL